MIPYIVFLSTTNSITSFIFQNLLFAIQFNNNLNWLNYDKSRLSKSGDAFRRGGF